jgi:hypothetical protein
MLFPRMAGLCRVQSRLTDRCRGRQPLGRNTDLRRWALRRPSRRAATRAPAHEFSETVAEQPGVGFGGVVGGADVTGGEEMELRVTDGGDGAGADHGDWAGARLACTE